MNTLNKNQEKFLKDQKIIYKDNTNIWKSITSETNPHVMNRNLVNRLNWLSPDFEGLERSMQFIQRYWTHIVTDESEKTEDVCLCGCTIKKLYIVQSSSGVKCQLGSECIKRINRDLIKKFKEESKTPGECYICGKHYVDIKKHYSSKVHKENKEKQDSILKKKLRAMYTEKIEVYEATVEKERRQRDIAKKYRECITLTCNELISKSEPEWKVRCLKCYKKQQKSKKS